MEDAVKEPAGHVSATAPPTRSEIDYSGSGQAAAQQLPLPDESVVDKYFHGGTATALTVDESGITLESAGP